MVSSRLFVIASAVVLALATPLRRDATTVENDINNKLTPDTNKLDSDLTAFPGSGLVGALTIHSDATTLNTDVQSSTTDAQNAGPFSEADGQTILGLVQGLEPTILDALNQIVAKKSDFQNLGVSGIPALILQDLNSLNASVIAFANALIADAPADLVPTATTIKDDIAAAFATAIAAYS